MKKHPVKILTGFVLLFFLYHAAEYMIVFENSPIGFLGFQLLFFLASWMVARWQTGSGFSAWGLGPLHKYGWHLVAGILLGIILYGGAFLIGLAAGAERIANDPSFVSVLSPFLLFVFGNFFSSFSEDILTRGYVYHHLKARMAGGAIVFVSALVYLLNHIYRLDDGVEVLAYLFILGILYALAMVSSGKLWFTGGIHWAGNCIFFYTHDIMSTEEAGGLSFNIILLVMVLLFCSLAYRLGRILQKNTIDPEKES